MSATTKRGISAWDNGTGGAKALTGTLTKSEGPALPRSDTDAVVLLTVTLSGTAPSKLYIQVKPSPDGGTTERGALPCIDSVSAGEVTYSDALHVKSSPSGSLKHTFPIRVFRGMAYTIYLKGDGTDGTSKAIAIADLLEDR